MIRKYFSISLSILLLICITIGTALWIRVFVTSIQTYRSPLQGVDLAPQPPAAPQTGKVVIVLVSGLGYDDSQALDLPFLEQLRRAGATAAIESTPPTYSQTAWATLITGALPDTNDAPPIDKPLEDLYPLETDTIFARAYDAQLKTALFGLADWRQLIPRQQLTDTFFADEPGPQADQAIVEAALPAIADDEISLVLIHLTQLDFAGQNLGGPAGQPYQQAAQTIDTYLGQISTALDLNQSALIVVSDHGHISDGGYGGNEVEVIWQPLVMLGEGIIPGNYSDIHQTDVAPTISILLGLAPPVAAQGRILFEMLEITESDQAIAQIVSARQRLALAEDYLPQIQGPRAALPEELSTDLNRAQDAFTQGNITGALRLALLAQDEADNQITTAETGRLRAERLPRFVAAALILLVWFATMWQRRGLHAGSIVVAMAVTIGLYHGLFQLQGYSYSVSSIGDFSTLPFDIIRRTAVSLLVGEGLIFIFLLLTKEDNTLILLGTGYGFGVLTTFVFALPLFWTFWQTGFAATWHLPAVVPAFLQMMGLFEVLTSASIGLIMPWPIAILCLIVSLARRQLSQSRPAEPDALPGLHL